MKRKLAMNPQPTTQPAVFRLGEAGTYVERTRHISDAIARRAYELFEARGFEHGPRPHSRRTSSPAGSAQSV